MIPAFSSYHQYISLRTTDTDALIISNDIGQYSDNAELEM